MAIFKYTVANKEGKKLSGTVEAPQEAIARQELNNLGFSILLLKETDQIPQSKSQLPKFVFESLDQNSKIIQGTVSATNKQEAILKLRDNYNVTITALWPIDASKEQIAKAREEGQKNLQDTALSQQQIAEENQQQNLQRQQISAVLKSLKNFLLQFKNKFAPDTQAEINKKLNKLLRIKNSNNLEYIKQSTDELIYFIREKDSELLEQGFSDKRFQLKMETKKMLNQLHQEHQKKSLSQDIVEKIENWQLAHIQNENKPKTSKIWLNKILTPIKNFFKTPIEVLTLKEQIKNYNKQIWEFRKIYFKEPTKEYKDKAAQSIKIIKKAKAKAKQNLKEVKQKLQERQKKQRPQTPSLNLTTELGTFTGWLLTFYISIYVIGLYLSSKNFGLSQIPQFLDIYNTHIFKYLLVIIFLIHSSIALKKHFFQNNKLADILLPSATILGSLLTIFNF